MMRTLLASAAIAAAFLGAGLTAASEARADAPPAGYKRHLWHGPAHRHYRRAPYSYGRYGHRHRHHGYRGYAIGPSFGGLPPFYPGHGSGAAPIAGMPVMMTFYREAYIGRGLIYNTPPQTTLGLR